MRIQIDQTLKNEHPAWLDDIRVVAKGTKQKHNVGQINNNEKKIGQMLDK